MLFRAKELTYYDVENILALLAPREAAIVTGRRITYSDGATLQNGDYWKDDRGWLGLTPNGLLANLRNHAVTEHEDGTITASPSIRVRSSGESGGDWHGYLERGAWREI